MTLAKRPWRYVPMEDADHTPDHRAYSVEMAGQHLGTIVKIREDLWTFHSTAAGIGGKSNSRRAAAETIFERYKLRRLVESRYPGFTTVDIRRDK